MQKPIAQNIHETINAPDHKTVISGWSGLAAFSAIFAVTFVLSVMFGDALLPQTGYFSELGNALAFPLRLCFSLMLAFMFYIFATMYDIKVKFFPLLVIVLFVVLGTVGGIVDSDIGETYTILLHLKPTTEQAIVVAAVTAILFLSAKMAIEAIHYMRHKTAVKLSASFYVLLLLVMGFWSGSVYVSVHNFEELKTQELTIQLPNTDKISTKIPADLEDVRSLKRKDSSTKVVYNDEPFIKDEKQSDYLTIQIPGHGTTLKDFCGTAGLEASTSNGIAYTRTQEEKNSSIPPLPENAYQQTKLCFVVGQYGYILSRNNAFGKTSYANYTDEEIIRLFEL